MRWAVFLRAVNVGGANRCRPALIVKELSNFGLINVGAVGTFAVRENVSEVVLRDAIAKKLSFKCEIMICPAGAITSLVSQDPFSGQRSASDIVRFVSILAKQPGTLPRLPFHLPTANDWGVKVIAIQARFVLGLYRRNMKAIGYLGKLEKLLGLPATTRNWTTIEKLAKVLEQDAEVELSAAKRRQKTRL